MGVVGAFRVCLELGELLSESFESACGQAAVGGLEGTSVLLAVVLKDGL
jgi:hypothetical protein